MGVHFDILISSHNLELLFHCTLVVTAFLNYISTN